MKTLNVFCFVLLILILVSGCHLSEDTSVLNDDATENEQTSVTEISNDNTFFRELTIYSIPQNVFLDFLEEPDIGVLKSDSSNKYTCSINEPWYVTYNATRFLCGPELLDFVDRSAFEEYLKDNGITETVEDLVIFEAPFVPITICAHTGNDYVFVTINEKFNDEKYVYRIYDYTEYSNKYGVKNADLKVNGRKADGVTALISHNYACVPLIGLLQEYNATVNWQNETEAIITINDEKYQLDIDKPSLFEYGDDKTNLLFRTVGGPSIYSVADKELFVDIYNVQALMYTFGEDVAIRHNVNNLLVTVDNRTM